MKDENGEMTPDGDSEAVEISRGSREISRDSRNRETVTTEYS